ncbi:hypothetical protein SNEBB_004077 [Seison nebaliae]|nr:hypothetical protein SNEBB_004077 [Seison nebaliae]
MNNRKFSVPESCPDGYGIKKKQGQGYQGFVFGGHDSNGARKLERTPPKSIRIELQHGSDRIALTVENKDSPEGPTIKDLKDLVKKHTYVPFCDQRIYYKGQSLQKEPDNEYLHKYYVMPNAQIAIGGAQQGTSCFTDCKDPADP